MTGVDMLHVPYRGAGPALADLLGGQVQAYFSAADEYAKPRAVRFTGEAPELLAKAAASMHLRLAEVTEPELAEIAAKRWLARHRRPSRTRHRRTCPLAVRPIYSGNYSGA